MSAEAFAAHLGQGVTTVARAWAVTRTDGVRLGFTDHDRDLAFDGVTFRAATGMSARAISAGTGLSVDNSEALGALRDDAIREADIAAGRYDGATVVSWLVNWRTVSERRLIFRGTIGEIRRANGAFHAELRGLAEALNRPMGRVFQTSCGAVLGDAACGVDLTQPAFMAEAEVIDISGAGLTLTASGHAAGWFAGGWLTVLTGAAAGLAGAIRRDMQGDPRAIELWEPLRAALAPGDLVRLSAGCDKRIETCRDKFANLVNFRGFPDLPTDDWLTAVPAASVQSRAGRRR